MDFFPASRRKTQRELFIALHLQDQHTEYFRKCHELENEVVVSARDSRSGNEGRTLLHSAAKLGSISVVRQLLGIGHQLDPIDSSVSLVTPLMEAICENHINLACLLVEAGANLFHLDIRSENCMHYAARVSSRMVIGLLKSSRLPKDKIHQLLSMANVKHNFPEDLANSDLTREVLHNFRIHGKHQPKNRKTLDSLEIILHKAKSKGHGFDYNFMFSSDSDDGSPLPIS